MKTAAVISTGSELLHGTVRDTNGGFICSRLFSTDLDVVLTAVVGDVPDRLSSLLAYALSLADLVIVTGGLGPTDDDHTLAVITSLTGLGTRVEENARARMVEFFATMKMTPNPGDIKMVTVPEGAEVFENAQGLAVGYALRFGGRLLIAMPGVPREMRPMFDEKVMPYLRERHGIGERRHFTFRTVLMRESEVNLRVRDMRVPFDEIEWGISTAPGMNTVTFVEKKGFQFPSDQLQHETGRIFGEYMIQAPTMEEELRALLAEKNATLAAAESCTGGLVAKRLTDVPGSSEVFLGGVVAYANDAKVSLLGVSTETLTRHGAVSEEVAREMAYGAMKKFGASIGISTTGIAGPGGGTTEKPVGTVCFGFASGDTLASFTRVISGDRERVRGFSSQIILDRVRRHLRGLV